MESIWLTHSPHTRHTRLGVYRLYVEPDLVADLADVTAPFVANWLAKRGQSRAPEWLWRLSDVLWLHQEGRSPYPKYAHRVNEL